LLGAKLPRWQARVRVWVAAAMVAFLVGASPVYLGWNWPTDALAGWALAASWLAIVVTTTTAIRRLRGDSPGAEAGTPPPAPLEVDSALSAPKRPRTDPRGLSEAQVRERIERGETNRTEERSSRSVGEILRANILTRFNAILGSLEVDESLLTGEAEPVLKAPGDVVLSGSFVVAGSSRIQATRVGDAAYARRLAAEGRRFAPPRSQLQAGIDRLLAYITWALVPTAVILFAGQLRAHIGLANAIRGSVAGVVGMVPEGLVLLASTAMALSVVRLARKRVLIQELQAVEGLARVDILCCDKTGTITDGSIKLDEVLPAPESETGALRQALGALAAATTRNATLEAIAAACPPPEGEGWKAVVSVAFSSAR